MSTARALSQGMAEGFSFPGLFVEHPVKPGEVIDPLAAPRLPATGAGPATRPSIGYACLWEADPKQTWSGTPWHLREVLRDQANVTDVGVELPSLTRMGLKAIHARYRNGHLTTSWCYSRLTDKYLEAALRRGIRVNFAGNRPDAILTIDTLAILDEPYFVYAYVSWDALIASADTPERFARFQQLPAAVLARRRAVQVAAYKSAQGIIAETRWLAKCLVEQSGVPAEKIHVIHPGLSVTQDQATRLASPPERAGRRRRLLFVMGQNEPHHFYRKGGDLALAALRLLRRDHDPHITLTIAGMNAWPLPGRPPEGVEFLRRMPPGEASALYDTHDLLLLPSRLESFGMIMVEALTRGMPCIARNAFAMPEIVTPGVSGTLIEGYDATELAGAIADALADDDLYQRCADRAPHVAEYFSWQRAAREVVEVLAGG